MTSSDDSFTSTADVWAKTLEIDPSNANRFDPVKTITSASDIGRVDVSQALEQLPRLRTETDGSTVPDLEFLGTLGTGGMARVRLAVQVPVGREIAVKELRSPDHWGTADRSEALHGLLREAWITGFLEHPNIVPIYRVGRDADGEPVIAMKRVEGVPWSRVLDDPESAPDPFASDDPLTRHLEILVQVCHAVEFAHDRGILHRDLKPENVLLGEFGEVYVADWGIAAGLDADRYGERIPSLAEVTTRVGTPAFIAPEMIEADVDRIDERSDIYLLGGILHDVLTGEPPHSGATMIEILVAIRESDGPELPDDVPPRLAQICERALAPEPTHRYPTVAALRRDLDEYIQHRESTQISDEAHRRLEKFERAVEDVDPDEDLRGDFATCRFGFEQALELSPDNARAKEGLQRLLETMIEREIEREGYQAASNYLADLPEPRPELESRVEQLGERVRNRDRKLERLQEFRMETDVEMGREPRILFVLAVGVLTAAMNLASSVWSWMGGAAQEGTINTAAFAVYAILIAGLIYRGRRRLIQNEANRKLLFGFLAILAVDGFARVLDFWMEMSPVATAANKAILVGGGLTVLAIAMDRHILWVAGSILLVAPLQLAAPAYALEISAAGVLGGTCLLAGSWWLADRSEQL